jgi:5,10-methylene-tetrahydrofolate dehydrogenase/methenyl tetrahydrofolate cyclohydrolase
MACIHFALSAHKCTHVCLSEKAMISSACFSQLPHEVMELFFNFHQLSDLIMIVIGRSTLSLPLSCICEKRNDSVTVSDWKTRSMDSLCVRDP